MKDISQIRASAVKFLSRREYCRQEMIQKLIGKGADSELAATVVEQLSDSGLISEERFARDLIQVRIRQGYGPVRIEHDLKQRGVADFLASTCLSESNTNWSDQLERVIERKYKQRPVESFADWAKRANFLRNRGFTAAQIERTLGRYNSSSQSN